MFTEPGVGPNDLGLLTYNVFIVFLMVPLLT